MITTSDGFHTLDVLEQGRTKQVDRIAPTIDLGSDTCSARTNTWHGLQEYVSALGVFIIVSLTLLVGWSSQAYASQTMTLEDISYSTLPGNRIRVELVVDGSENRQIKQPLSFAIDKPARIVLDLADVRSNLAKKTQQIGIGMARSVTAVEGKGRTRVVFNLTELVPYEIQAKESSILVTLNSALARSSSSASDDSVASGRIRDLDFRRGPHGEGRILVRLSKPATVIDTRQEAGNVIVEFFDTQLPKHLERRLDVVDFATPVQAVDASSSGNDARIVVKAKQPFEHLAYQTDDLYTIEIKPLSQAEQEALKKREFRYTGERLSLNFQNIEVRAVLQLLADFTGLNLVASDSVGGSVTLRLKNVPWDQALDIILKAKGLGMRKVGNVIMVAPIEEIAARERLELEAQKEHEELAPLHTEFVQINYAKAADLANLLKSQDNSLLSERGHVSVDERTNTLLVRDTADNLTAIRQLVATLDIPVRQVLIESRIVIADDTFSRDLGVKFGYSRTSDDDVTEDQFFTLGGKLPGDTDFGDTTSFNTDGNENFIVDLPVASPTGALGFAVGRVTSHLLQLELSAAQEEGRGETLSNPRVITSDRKEAVIEQGAEIPFQEATSSGATSTSFKKAVLSLKVKPQITPDDRIIMDIQVNKDRPGREFSGVPSVDTRSVTTQVLVDNGETVVIGGIYEQDVRKDRTSVPFFSDLPLLGFLFEQNAKRDDKRELLIFVTPKILKEKLMLR